MLLSLSQLLRFSKSFCWALLGTFLTFLIALFVTTDPTASVAIGVLEFVFTTLTYYVHEFIWDRASHLWNFSLHRHWISVSQALSWRITGTLLTIGIVFGLTGQVDSAIQVGIGEVIVKVAVYYGYARLWLWIMRKVEKRRRGPWGKLWHILRFLNPRRYF